MKNPGDTSKEVFFNKDAVKNCFNVTSKTNQILLSFMLNAGYKSVTDFAFALGISRSRLSQIIHGHIPPDTQLKLKIAKALNTDTIIIFGVTD